MLPVPARVKVQPAVVKVMLRPTDQETTAIEKVVCYSHFRERHRGATQGSTRVGQGAEDVVRKRGQCCFVVVSTGKARKGRIYKLRTNSLNNSSWLWGIGLSVSVWYGTWLWGDLGRWMVAWSVRALERSGWGGL